MDRPILFKAPMVRAMLDGRKTQTRRMLTPPIDGGRFAGLERDGSWLWTRTHLYAKQRPTCCVGDRLWVRETWQEFLLSELPPDRPRGPRGRFGIPAERAKGNVSYVTYRADGEMPPHPKLGAAVWRAAGSMPRWASRLTLTVSKVRVERLQDISEADAIAEGVSDTMLANGTMLWDAAMASSEGVGSAKHAFAELWGVINGLDEWGANPWVCATTFTVHPCNVDALPPLPSTPTTGSHP